MKDPSKAKQQLIEENAVLKHRIRELEEAEAALKRAEEALRESERKYGIIVEKMTDIVWMTDMNLRTVYVTPSIRTVLGYSQEERMRQSIKQQLTLDSLAYAMDVISKELALETRGPGDVNRKVVLELEYYHKDGSTRWMETTMTWVRNDQGAMTGLHGVSRDITDRKRAEDALRKSEELSSRLISAVPDMVMCTDLNGEIIFVNEVGLETSGFAKTELIGRHFLSFMDPEDHERAIRNMNVMAGQKLGPQDYALIMKDGRRQWFEVNGDVLRTKAGAPYGMVYVSRDITGRKHAEEEKEKMQLRLGQSQKLEAIGTLAAGIAHDFNNLLMGIQGNASLMLLDLDPSHPYYGRLKRIEEEVRSGADLTGQLLGFASGGRYEVKPVSIRDIIQKTSSIFARTRKEVSIYSQYGKEPCIVEADQGQMEQVFMNLYLNAWQAMPGGGEIRLETRQIVLEESQAIALAVSRGRRYVKITVTDTGTGMDEKTRERIFDPFFTTKGMGRGTGLGLATVYGIIRGHGGAIHVDSEPGRGTTFIIHLPASKMEATKEKKDTGAIARGTETILLVDDEEMILDVSKELLESLGYRVYAVGSGQEAVSAYLKKRDEIDLVILDMIMPGISGGKTFDRLLKINPEVRVLLATGYSVGGQARRILARGCKGFIQKPFQLGELAQSVREILDWTDISNGHP